MGPTPFGTNGVEILLSSHNSTVFWAQRMQHIMNTCFLHVSIFYGDIWEYDVMSDDKENEFGVSFIFTM